MTYNKHKRWPLVREILGKTHWYLSNIEKADKAMKRQMSARIAKSGPQQKRKYHQIVCSFISDFAGSVRSRQVILALPTGI
jgi:hypothetical protein